MVALLLEKPKKKKTRASSQKLDSSTNQFLKNKNKMPEVIIFENTEGEDNCEDELPQYSSDEGGSERSQDPHHKKMKKLEERLEAISHRSDLQDVGIVRPYPA